MGEVIAFPTPGELTPEQRDYYHKQAAYWGVREDDAYTALEYAQRQRQKALRMLGMLGVEHGLEDLDDEENNDSV